MRQQAGDAPHCVARAMMELKSAPGKSVACTDAQRGASDPGAFFNGIIGDRRVQFDPSSVSSVLLMLHMEHRIKLLPLRGGRNL
jgi:hypothetical protein